MLRRTKRIDLLDIGFEDAQRLIGLASKEKHRKKRFVGIEVTKAKVQHKLHNLNLVYADAFDRLKRMRPNSVRIMTTDFLFTEFKVNGVDLAELGWRRNLFEKAFLKRRVDLSKEVARVLVPNGRFVVIEYKENLAPTLEVLKDAGFSCSVKPVPEQDLAKTKFLKLIQEKRQQQPNMRERMQPMRIVARKRKGWPNETR
ncbi:MAG: hypothetical protein WCI04_00630 [archaeon]